MKRYFVPIILISLLSGLLSSCSGTPVIKSDQRLQVLAADSTLADITRNIAGDRVDVSFIIPLGIDPHTFEPTPKEVALIQRADLLVTNGAGYEGWLEKLLMNAGGSHPIIEASKGLPFRIPGKTELSLLTAESGPAAGQTAGDPHFWLDPILVKKYAENIRDGLIEIDPAGREIYSTNTAAYQQQLDGLDKQITSMVAEIPENQRILVTNHESFGYYADRYGFLIIGTIIPGTSSGSSPSAKQVANLINNIKSTSAPAIFIEAGSNPDIAEQIARESHVKLVTGLITHSLTDKNGGAETYIKMMLFNTKLIVDGLR